MVDKLNYFIYLILLELLIFTVADVACKLSALKHGAFILRSTYKAMLSMGPTNWPIVRIIEKPLLLRGISVMTEKLT